MADIPDDEVTGFGWYTPENKPDFEDELLAIILDLVDLECLTDNDDLDSWGISSYERAIEVLDEAGLVEIDCTRGRIYAKLRTAARGFKDWMEFHNRRKATARGGK